MPGKAKSEAETVVVIDVLLTSVEASGAPSNCTVEPLANPVPVSVTVASAPIGAPPGVIAESTGTEGSVMVTVTPSDVIPAGVLSVMVAVPVALRRLAGTIPTRSFP